MQLHANPAHLHSYQVSIAHLNRPRCLPRTVACVPFRRRLVLPLAPSVPRTAERRVAVSPPAPVRSARRSPVLDSRCRRCRSRGRLATRTPRSAGGPLRRPSRWPCTRRRLAGARPATASWRQSAGGITAALHLAGYASRGGAARAWPTSGPPRRAVTASRFAQSGRVLRAPRRHRPALLTDRVGLPLGGPRVACRALRRHRARGPSPATARALPAPARRPTRVSARRARALRFTLPPSPPPPPPPPTRHLPPRRAPRRRPRGGRRGPRCPR